MAPWLDPQKPLTLGGAEMTDRGRRLCLPRGVDSFHSSHGALAPSAARVAEPAFSDDDQYFKVDGRGRGAAVPVGLPRPPPAARTSAPAPEQVQEGACVHASTRTHTQIHRQPNTRTYPHPPTGMSAGQTPDAGPTRVHTHHPGPEVRPTCPLVHPTLRS